MNGMYLHDGDESYQESGSDFVEPLRISSIVKSLLHVLFDHSPSILATIWIAYSIVVYFDNPLTLYARTVTKGFLMLTLSYFGIQSLWVLLRDLFKVKLSRIVAKLFWASQLVVLFALMIICFWPLFLLELNRTSDFIQNRATHDLQFFLHAADCKVKDGQFNCQLFQTTVNRWLDKPVDISGCSLRGKLCHISVAHYDEWIHCLLAPALFCCFGFTIALFHFLGAFQSGL